MAIPTPKSMNVDRFLCNFFKIDRRKAIMVDQCSVCGKDIDHDNFRDQTSQNEYQISGTCQQCQDRIYQ